MTEDKLKELREKHKGCYELTVPLNDDGTETATVFLRKLDRVVYASVSKLIQKDELMAVESLLKSLHVGGDDVKLITEDFDALRSASTGILPMLTARDASLKKN